jgi:hypothetical protein
MDLYAVYDVGRIEGKTRGGLVVGQFEFSSKGSLQTR